MTASFQEINYRLRRAAFGHEPGRHRARWTGAGLEPMGTMSIDRIRGRLRLDLSASLRDPFRRLLASTSRQLASVDVVVALDVSASMLAEDAARQRTLFAQFVLAVGHSALRFGDAFGLIVFGEQVDRATVLPPSHQRSKPELLSQQVRESPFSARHARGVRDIAAFVRRVHSVVFLVSDFLMPLTDLRFALDTLARHVVIPIVVGRLPSAAVELPPGLKRLVDRETGARRWVWMRASIRQAAAARYATHAAALEKLFARYGCRPFYLAEALDIDALNAHLAS